VAQRGVCLHDKGVAKLLLLLVIQTRLWSRKMKEREKKKSIHSSNNNNNNNKIRYCLSKEQTTAYIPLQTLPERHGPSSSSFEPSSISTGNDTRPLIPGLNTIPAFTRSLDQQNLRCSHMKNK